MTFESFSLTGNVFAFHHRLGLIVTYCYCHPLGLSLLKLACASRSKYTVQLIERACVDQEMTEYLDFHVSDGMTIPDLLQYIRCCDNSIPSDTSDQSLAAYVDSRQIEDEPLESHHKHISDMHNALIEYKWTPLQGRFDIFINKRKPDLLHYQRSLYKKMPEYLEHLIWDIMQLEEYQSS